MLDQKTWPLTQRTLNTPRSGLSQGFLKFIVNQALTCLAQVRDLSLRRLAHLVTAAPPDASLASSRNGRRWDLYIPHSQSTSQGFSAAGSMICTQDTKSCRLDGVGTQQIETVYRLINTTTGGSKFWTGVLQQTLQGLDKCHRHLHTGSGNMWTIHHAPLHPMQQRPMLLSREQG